MIDNAPKAGAGTVAVLGMGLMGSAMAGRLLGADFEVRVWNRTPEKCAEPAAAGAVATSTPAEAARGARAVISMLADGAATEAVMAGPHGALAAMEPDALWLQMGTVGVAACERLTGLAADAGIAFVDAPVLGSREPAKRGELVVLASGPEEARVRCAPIFAALGQETLWLGPAGAGSRLKLVVNGWILSLVTSVAESMAFSQALGLDPTLFLDAIAGRPMDSPYAQSKGHAMAQGDFRTAFPLRLAHKDARLILEAAEESGVDLPLAREVATHFADALALGHGDDDMAAVVTAIRTISRP